MGCVFARVHVQLQTRSLHLRNGCTNCAEIWFAVSGAYSQKLGTFPLPIQDITAHARRIFYVHTPIGTYLWNGWVDFNVPLWPVRCSNPVNQM